MGDFVSGDSNRSRGSATAEGALALSGKNNSLVLNEAADQFGMQDDAKIIDGGNVEMGGVMAGGDYLGAGAFTLGDNSSFYQTALDDKTKSIIDQAFAVVGANSNNMMAFAAGRDANKDLSDESNEIVSEKLEPPSSNSFNKFLIGLAVALGLFIAWNWGKK